MKRLLKGIIPPKVIFFLIYALFTYIHVVPNPYDFLNKQLLKISSFKDTKHLKL